MGGGYNAAKGLISWEITALQNLQWKAKLKCHRDQGYFLDNVCFSSSDFGWRIEVIFTDFVSIPTFYGADFLDFNGHKLNLINRPDNGELSVDQPLVLDWQVTHVSSSMEVSCL